MFFLAPLCVQDSNGCMVIGLLLQGSMAQPQNTEEPNSPAPKAVNLARKAHEGKCIHSSPESNDKAVSQN